MESKVEAKDKAPEFTPSYTVMPNGQVQMTMVLPPMHPSQYPAALSPEAFAPQNPHAPPQVQQVPQMPQFPQAFSQTPNGPVHFMPPYPYAYQYPQYQYPMHYPQPQPVEGPKPGLAIGSLVTFIVGLFTFFPHVASIIMSFVMVKKGYLQGARKRVVLAFAILELLSWLACASMSWFFTSECEWSYQYNSYYSYKSCYDVYWGWIFIVVWFSFALMFGIARVVIEFNYAKRPTTTPLPTSNAYIPLSSPVNHSM